MPFDYDLLVIGAGSGGLAAAERVAQYGARVAIAERADPGGACVNYGCIPEKLLDYAAGFAQFDRIASSFGWDVINRRFDWSAFIAAKDQHIQRLNQIHLKHLQEADVTFIQGHAAFADAHTVRVGDQAVTADKILIAVGAEPATLPIPGIEHAGTWHDLYHLPQQPDQVAVIGGSFIGVKMAGSLNALGSSVTQIVAEDRILPDIDAEIGQAIQDKMMQQGVKILSQTHIKAIERVSDRLSLSLSESSLDPLMVDTLLVDAPRVPALTALNLGTAGIEHFNGLIHVDDHSRTTQPNVFAVGDCTGRIALTPSAIAQGRAFADTEFGQHPRTVSLEWVPLSISSRPEAATVGLSETQAREKFGEAIRCYHTQFRPLLYCLEQAEVRSLIKLVVNQKDSERVVGVHMVGDGAVEIIQSLTPALKLGLTKKNLDTTIGIHPSSAEELFSI